jgi:uncharacterized membrane protein YfhO
MSIIVFNNYLLFVKAYIFKDIGSDSYNHAYPFFVHISNYIRNEGIPKWSFSQGMGQNIFPGGSFNPFCFILCMLDPNHLAYGIVYVEIFKILLCGIFFYLYLETLLTDRYIASVGAILCSFSGYIILGSSGWYVHSLFVTYGAFFLFSFEKLFKKNEWIFFPISVALIGSFSPFYLYMFGVFIFFYAIFRYFNEYGADIKGLLLFYLKLFCLTVLGISMSSIFFFSELQRMLQSPRIGGEAGYYNTLLQSPVFAYGSFEHNITALFRLFSNDILGTGSHYHGWYNYLEAPVFYCGIITIILTPQLFFLISKQKRLIFCIFFTFWVLMVIFPFFRYAFYLFTGNYYKGGLSFFIPVIFIFYSLTALNIIKKKKTINLPVLFATFILLIIILYFPYFPEKASPIVKEIRTIVTSFIIIYSILVYLLSIKKYSNIAKMALLIIICVEAILFSYITVNKRFVVTKDELNDKVGYNDYTMEVLKYLQSHDKSFYRINKDYASGISKHTSLNDAMIQGYYGTSSYYSFNQMYYIKFLSDTGVIQTDNEHATRWALGLIARPFLQTFASVKYNLVKLEDSAYLKFGYEKIKTFNNVHLLKNKNFLPLGFTYDKYISYENFMQLTARQKEIILFRCVVINQKNQKIHNELDIYRVDDTPGIYTMDLYQKDIAVRKKDVFNIHKHAHNFIKGDIHLEKKKLLFFSIPYDKGWIAIVDGQKVFPELVNVGFMGLMLEQGNHTIELKYTLPYFDDCLAISILSLLIYFVSVYFYCNRKNKT